VATSYDVNVEADRNSNSNYQGIIDAFNTLRAAQGDAKKYYPPNYQGIIRAILDLQKWGQAGDGDYPPGWEIIVDGDGNIEGGQWNPPPSDGTLWFDTRQGRLFIWVQDGFYQTNGGDGLPYVSDDPPEEEIKGHLWYNTSNRSLYLWDGDSWVIVSTDTIDTSTLILAEGTTSEFKLNRPFLPDTDGLYTQQDYNKYLYNALEKLEAGIEDIDPVVPLYMDAVPPQNPNEGDFWYDTLNIQLLVSYDNQWVPTALPLTAQTDFQQLTAQVAQVRNKSIADIALINSRLHQYEQLPHNTYWLYTDENQIIQKPASTGIYLRDQNGLEAKVLFTGSDGIAVTSIDGSIDISAQAIETQIGQIIDNYAHSSDLTPLSDSIFAQQLEISALKAVNHPTLTQVNDLETAIQTIPTLAEVGSKLSAASATLQGAMNANEYTIQNLPTPTLHSDAATKGYVDSQRHYVDTTFVKKSSASFEKITVGNYDALEPGIDFSGTEVFGSPAFKFKTNGGDYATFGTTDNTYEYAWKFSGKEEFSYIHNSQKKVAINEDGLTARRLFLGEIGVTNENGSSISNKIDVGERLAQYKTALTGIRVALNTSTTFDEFKAQVLPALSGI